MASNNENRIICVTIGSGGEETFSSWVRAKDKILKYPILCFKRWNTIFSCIHISLCFSRSIVINSLALLWNVLIVPIHGKYLIGFYPLFVSTNCRTDLEIIHRISLERILCTSSVLKLDCKSSLYSDAHKVAPSKKKEYESQNKIYLLTSVIILI